MSEKFIEHLKQIENLQGSIQQNMMDAFNELAVIEEGFESIDTTSVANVKQLKHLILTRLKTSIKYINGKDFREACITCKAIRVLAILKQVIASSYLSDEERITTLGEAVVEHKIDKKYTEDFYGATQALKTAILKFISSKTLRKQFQINAFCIQLLQKEKKHLEANFPEAAEIILPDWVKNLNEIELDEFCSQAVELLNKEDYEAFNKFTNEK